MSDAQLSIIGVASLWVNGNTLKPRHKEKLAQYLTDKYKVHPNEAKPLTTEIINALILIDMVKLNS